MMTIDDVLGMDLAYFGEPFIQLSNAALGDSQSLDFAYFAEPLVFTYQFGGGSVEVPVGEEKPIDFSIAGTSTLTAGISKIKELRYDALVTSGDVFEVARTRGVNTSVDESTSILESIYRQRAVNASIDADSELNLETVTRLREHGYSVLSFVDIAAALSIDRRLGMALDAQFGVDDRADIAVALARLRVMNTSVLEQVQIDTTAGVKRYIAFKADEQSTMTMVLPRKRDNNIAVSGGTDSSVSVARVRHQGYVINVRSANKATVKRAIGVIANIGEVSDAIAAIERERGAVLNVDAEIEVEAYIGGRFVRPEVWTATVYETKVIVEKGGVYRVVSSTSQTKL